MRHCRFFWFGILASFWICDAWTSVRGVTLDLRKTQDIVIYQHERFYCAFPSIVRRPDGELLVAFRRAPERRAWGESGTSHTDPNSQLVLVRSRDRGQTWTQPELIYAHPIGGSQDPCLLQLRGGELVCSSYAWAWLQPSAAAKADPALRHGNFVFLGGYLLRSADGGRTWKGPILPPTVPGESSRDPYGQIVPAYNRGQMCEGADGRVYWAVAANNSINPRLTATHLLVSTNRGDHWSYYSPIAVDDKVTFNETSLYETPKGDLVAFMRTAGFNDHTAIARSTNHGRSFEKWADAGFRGHPHYALRLPDRRVLLVYGYRHQPFGVRARVLDEECVKLAAADELILRDDGSNADLGYPWAVELDNKTVLVVYYFNSNDGLRHIAGTFLTLE
jgi:hypothetical protein